MIIRAFMLLIACALSAHAALWIEVRGDNVTVTVTTNAPTQSTTTTTTTTSTTTTTQPPAPAVGRVVAFGDSITAADYAGAGTGYAALVSASMGATCTSWAVSGTVVHQWISNLLGRVVYSNDVLLTVAGMNDMRSSGDSDTRIRQTYRDALGFLCGWLAAPPNGKLAAYASAITYAGAWSAGSSYPPYWTNRYSSTPGASASFTFTGTRFALGLTRSPTTSARLAVIVDGQTVTNIAETGYSPLYLQYGSYGPQFVVITGLSYSAHSVRLEVATNANTFIEYVVLPDAGLKPRLILGNCLAIDPAYYGGGAPWDKVSSNAIDRVNAAVADVVRDLQSAGYDVRAFDAHAAYTPDSAHRADWLHPNGEGHRQIATAFTNAWQP